MNAHHGCAHSNARHLRFKLALKLTREVRYIGGGAAHVKANHLVVSRTFCRTGHAHNAASGSTQNGIFACEGMRISEATRGLHEHQFNARHFAGHLIDIATQDG